MFVIKNATIYDFNTFQEDMYIVFDEVIHEVGKMKDYVDDNYEEIDAINQIVMPGLINGHSHIYSTFARGMNVPFNPKDFKELLEQLWWKLDRNLTNEMTYYSGIVSGVDYLKNGVTTIIDHHASGEIKNSLNHLKKAVCDEVNLRGVFCFETSDRFDVDDCILENINFIQTNNTNHSKGLFGMHAAFTLSNESLEKISDKLDNNPIHIHVAESKLDQEHSIKKHHERVIYRLNRHNLITENSIITHGLYLHEEELEIINENKAVVALNVTSNMNNAVGLPNYFKMKDAQVKMIIGNDGISMNMASEYKMLYYAMHHLSLSPTKFNFDDLINLINNTYIYTSEILNTKLGKIKKGYQADLSVIPYINPTPLNEDNIFGHLFFGLFNDYKPKEVFVRGKHILNNYQVSSELNNKYKEAKNKAQELWKKVEKEGKL